MARSLELPANMDLGVVEIDISPSEPQRFATPQAENENQHVGRIQRVVLAPGGFQEGTGLCRSERVADKHAYALHGILVRGIERRHLE